MMHFSKLIELCSRKSECTKLKKKKITLGIGGSQDERHLNIYLETAMIIS